MFFFRLHNLRREEEKKRRRKKGGSGQLTRDPSPLTLAPSRLFEKSPVTPSDSLDEIAFQIPRRYDFKANFSNPSPVRLMRRFYVYKSGKRSLKRVFRICRLPANVSSLAFIKVRK
ncbi:hypothetical protein PGB90_001333 [Kerria lacca]